MDVVRFKGGLGNQMFQYAFLKSLEYRGRKVGASLGFYGENPKLMQYELDRTFPNIVMNTGFDKEFFEAYGKWCRIKSDDKKVDVFRKDLEHRYFWNETTEEGGNYQEGVYLTKECVFVGFWQTEKYFTGFRRELLKDFQFREGEERLAGMRKIFSGQDYYVSVHIRRGDYLKCQELYGNICTERYYGKAMEYIRQRVPKPVFVFFSDDMEWVKKSCRMDNAIYIVAGMFEHYEAWYDMCLMSCCAHNIVANSTFSWWGAWLNQRADQIVIAPEKWMNNRKKSDRCPAGWVRL